MSARVMHGARRYRPPAIPQGVADITPPATLKDLARLLERRNRAVRSSGSKREMFRLDEIISALRIVARGGSLKAEWADFCGGAGLIRIFGMRQDMTTAGNAILAETITKAKEGRVA